MSASEIDVVSLCGHWTVVGVWTWIAIVQPYLRATPLGKLPNEKEEIMMFRRLQSLGEEKFRRIADELKRGTPVIFVARLIQQEWGDCHDLPEDKLAEQLKGLYVAISNGASGGDLEEKVKSSESVRMKLMQGSTPSCLDQLVELALIQRQRMLAFSERETRRDSIIPELTTIMKDYRKLLVLIQDMKFDLGIDEYRRGMSAAKKHFEDWENQAAEQAIIYDAYATVEKIFEKRFGSEANPAKRSN